MYRERCWMTHRWPSGYGSCFGSWSIGVSRRLVDSCALVGRVGAISGQDRISHLPDYLVFKILSFIPLSTDAMTTSLLSKRWKPLWKMMPTLEYDENTCPNIGLFRLQELCKRSLVLHKGPVLKPLNLKLKLKHKVLKLEGQILIDVDDSSVCFKSLRTLHLEYVNFNCEKTFATLLSCCPVLECLFLQRNLHKRLCITKEASYNFRDDSVLEINAPFVIVEAHVADNFSKTWKLLKALTSVEHLWLDLYPSMLLHLELNIYEFFCANLLLCLLKDFPNLRVLKLNHTHPNYDIEDHDPDLVFKPSSVPKCLTFHLETFIRKLSFDIEVAIYVLNNACCLKNATISLQSICTKTIMMMISEL
ncbi:hypothetical protein CARUB_v10024863mg [Capsella rubella]|uniref:Uncharacterized protein n=1 Tax=Capsella rubella TaxID=81985 RepID=R0G0H0_9BRAS|nr:hypothetical protein CARUB_v10024863mg [Capsella rubella]